MVSVLVNQFKSFNVFKKVSSILFNILSLISDTKL